MNRSELKAKLDAAWLPMSTMDLPRDELIARLADATRKAKALEGGWGDMEDACNNLLRINKEYESDLSAAREQLAEMREILEPIAEVTIFGGTKTRLKEECATWVKPEWVHAARKTLSAAPAGGRVLSRKGWAILMYTDKGDSYTMIELAGPPLEGFTEDGEEAIVTVRKAPPKEAEDDDWPRECPRCGAAGGSELGPCPMCKGAGFIDKE